MRREAAPNGTRLSHHGVPLVDVDLGAVSQPEPLEPLHRYLLRQLMLGLTQVGMAYWGMAPPWVDPEEYRRRGWPPREW